MNRLTDGTQWRSTPVGYLLVRGKREIYISARSVAQDEIARRLIATRSFNQLFKAGRRVAGIKNTAHITIQVPGEEN
ncbi:hypothetical protein ACFVBP_28410 [Nocardioides sp. NPDC057764]|uniref:hypothetical protein n=1 Tax=Nocardioides sp. NPDC057764 TaxID=3346243 RepID=UPI003672B983